MDGNILSSNTVINEELTDVHLYNLRMAWWNVSLSPTASKSKPTLESYETVCEHLKYLLTDLSCDLVAVCEVSTEDIAYISSNLNLTNIDIIDLTDNAGRSRFDIAVIYNNKKIRAERSHQIYKSLTGNTIKAAQLVEVLNLDDGKAIKLFLCHWPSRLNGDGQIRRNDAARMVYQEARELMEEGSDVIIMGDFNDNPYDESILTSLNATRCHDAVRNYPKEYFYNPFWRSVVSDNMYTHVIEEQTFRSGTHRYKQYQGTMWHSYDQIVFSGSFLGKGAWHLNELNTKVIEDNRFLIEFESKDSSIDHLPVLCEITKP